MKVIWHIITPIRYIMAMIWHIITLICYIMTMLCHCAMTFCLVVEWLQAPRGWLLLPSVRRCT
jgi:hypothetical protein